MITINETKKAEIDARVADVPRDVTAELDALKAALVKKNVVTDIEIEAQSSEPAQDKA